MLKRLFISFLILSTLTAEGTVPSAAYASINQLFPGININQCKGIIGIEQAKPVCCLLGATESYCDVFQANNINNWSFCVVNINAQIKDGTYFVNVLEIKPKIYDKNTTISGSDTSPPNPISDNKIEYV